MPCLEKVKSESLSIKLLFFGYEKEDGSITSDVNDPDIKKDENGKPVIKEVDFNEDRARLIWRIYWSKVVSMLTQDYL